MVDTDAIINNELHMAKIIASVLGIVYVLAGIIGFFNTGFIGSSGYFASNALYDVAVIVVGAVLLIGAFATERVRTVNIVMGVILGLFALLSFAIATGGATSLGMLVNAADDWVNLLFGIILIGSGMVSQPAEQYGRSHAHA